MKDLMFIGGVKDCAQIQAHDHQNWEMIYYTRGRVQLTIGSEAYTLSPGTFVCQPPRLPHGEQGMNTFDNLFFSVASFDILPNRALFVQDTADNAIGNLIHHMYIAFNAGSPNGRLICEALLYAIVQYVIGQMGTSALANPYVERFRMLLLANVSNYDFKVSELEASIPFSIDYFRLLFKRDTGCTPHEYLSRIRIDNAKHLLDSGFYRQGLTVSAVSRMCGFSDPLYFSRCFKVHTGMTPSRWVEVSRKQTCPRP